MSVAVNLDINGMCLNLPPEKSILVTWRWTDKRAEPFVLSLIFLFLQSEAEGSSRQKKIKRVRHFTPQHYECSSLPR